jgi:hypothetical protein
MNVSAARAVYKSAGPRKPYESVRWSARKQKPRRREGDGDEDTAGGDQRECTANFAYLRSSRK